MNRSSIAPRCAYLNSVLDIQGLIQIQRSCCDQGDTMENSRGPVGQYLCVLGDLLLILDYVYEAYHSTLALVLLAAAQSVAQSRDGQTDRVGHNLLHIKNHNMNDVCN